MAGYIFIAYAAAARQCGKKNDASTGVIEWRLKSEPAGRVDFQSKGYLKPAARFTVILPADAGTAGKLTLMASQRCNLHGLCEGSLDIAVS